MGNIPDRCRKMQQPYNQMVEDAIAALKDRPGSTQADIFNYLEAKYEGKISPKNKQNLQTVIRSVIQMKKRLRTGMGRSPPREKLGGRGGGGARLKGARGGRLGKRKLPGRGGRGRTRGPTLGGPKGLKMKLLVPKSVKASKMGNKKLAVPKLLRSMKRATGRGGKLLLRPARRTTSEGSLCLPRVPGCMRRN